MAIFADTPSRPRRAAYLACALAVLVTVPCGPSRAQSAYRQPMVQSAPPASLGELNAALKDLSRDPGNVPALVRAGWASLELDDTQSALGFFRRAAAIQPQNGEVKAGLASSSLRQGDPLAAVGLFGEAEAAGAPMFRYAGDRGLALDLVGNNRAAQQFYRQALAVRNDPEIVRRLALSQAIGGDERATEATLLPLLQTRDLASYRTRAFALAILGKGEEAVSIAQTMLPAPISSRLAPYLRYMPRLTRAQQAAAANLGQFPPAAEIGHDNPQIAAISAAAAPQIASTALDSRLVPAGEPLGRSGRKSISSNRADKRAARSAAKRGKAGGNVSVTYVPLPQAPVPQPAPPAALPVPRVAAAVQPATAAAQISPPVETVSMPGQLAASPPAQAKSSAIAAFDLQPSAVSPSPPVEPATRPSLSISAAAPPPKPATSLADAFSDFANPAPPARSATDAVDILKIKPARQTPKVEATKPEAAKAKAKPKPPADPQRFWAQVATGRNVKALAFDWRRLQREGGPLLARRDAYTARWGQTRRLLVGPYKSEDEAGRAVAALKKKGIDAFEFTSDEGEEVGLLK